MPLCISFFFGPSDLTRLACPNHFLIFPIMAPAAAGMEHFLFEDHAVLGCDVGQVLSGNYTGNTWDPPHWSAAPGAWPFLVLFTVNRGSLRDFAVVTRTNQGRIVTASGQDCWVVRFCESMGCFSMGMLYTGFDVVKSYAEKGPAAAAMGCDMFIDDHLECLLAVHRSLPECKLIGFSCTGRTVDFYRNTEVPDSFWDVFIDATGNSWRDVSEWFGFGVTDAVWMALNRRGPPARPHSPNTIQWLHEIIYPPVPRSLPVPEEADEEAGEEAEEAAEAEEAEEAGEEAAEAEEADEQILFTAAHVPSLV